jgi:hypothetical protein
MQYVYDAEIHYYQIYFSLSRNFHHLWNLVAQLRLEMSCPDSSGDSVESGFTPSHPISEISYSPPFNLTLRMWSRPFELSE